MTIEQLRALPWTGKGETLENAGTIFTIHRFILDPSITVEERIAAAKLLDDKLETALRITTEQQLKDYIKIFKDICTP